jgi:Domain of unknown function (DUF4404)
MSDESLRDLLERVHQRLSGDGALDARSREMLKTLMHDIERALAQQGKKPGQKLEAAPRLEALAVKFESDHPALAGVLRQLADTLGKAGI